jgi:hypothetical protein
VQKLTEEEQKLFRLYGKLPTHKNMISKMQKVRRHAVSGGAERRLNRAARHRTASSSTRETTRFQRPAKRRRRRLAPRSRTQRSAYCIVVCASVLMSPPASIPHATPSPSINTANMSPGLLPGGASGNSITSPIRESPIAHPLEESTQPVASGGAERTAPILDAPVANPEPLPEALDNKEAMAQD